MRSLALLVLPLLALVGCRESTEETLLGSWVGRPDSAAQRAERSPSTLEQIRAAATEKDESRAAERSAPTDLEAFDFRITLDFAPRGELSMRLDGEASPGAASRRGSWRVVDRIGDLVVLELTDLNPAGAAAEEPAASSVQRRFEARMEPSGGFTMREEGADPQFGWLYFQRAGAGEARRPAPSP